MKLKELTPNHLKCEKGCCPGVYDDQEGHYVVIGKKLSELESKVIIEKVGDDEVVLKISKEFFNFEK